MNSDCHCGGACDGCAEERISALLDRAEAFVKESGFAVADPDEDFETRFARILDKTEKYVECLAAPPGVCRQRPDESAEDYCRRYCATMGSEDRGNLSCPCG